MDVLVKSLTQMVVGFSLVGGLALLWWGLFGTRRR